MIEILRKPDSILVSISHKSRTLSLFDYRINDYENYWGVVVLLLKLLEKGSFSTCQKIVQFMQIASFFYYTYYDYFSQRDGVGAGRGEGVDVPEKIVPHIFHNFQKSRL